jgi:hypothetical protein
LANPNDPALIATINAMQRPEVDTSDRAPFAKLVHDERMMERVAYQLDQAVKRSFIDDARKNPDPLTPPKVSRIECQRRLRICIDWIRQARGDLQYSWEQTFDQMQHALRCQLDGIVFNPRAAGSHIWTPT